VTQEKGFDVDSKSVGALPIVNQFLKRVRLTAYLEKHLPRANPRMKMTAVRALEVLVRNIILCRQPLYSVGEWAHQMVPGLRGLKRKQVRRYDSSGARGGYVAPIPRRFSRGPSRSPLSVDRQKPGRDSADPPRFDHQSEQSQRPEQADEIRINSSGTGHDTLTRGAAPHRTRQGGPRLHRPAWAGEQRASGRHRRARV
jgi:hypothetical protein